jgi:hypothetical protein
MAAVPARVEAPSSTREGNDHLVLPVQVSHLVLLD